MKLNLNQKPHIIQYFNFIVSPHASYFVQASSYAFLFMANVIPLAFTHSHQNNVLLRFLCLIINYAFEGSYFVHQLCNLKESTIILGERGKKPCMLFLYVADELRCILLLSILQQHRYRIPHLMSPTAQSIKTTIAMKSYLICECQKHETNK